MTKMNLVYLFINFSTLVIFTFASDPEIVSRLAWKARPEVEGQNLVQPVPYVVIHHSYTPSACNTSDQCLAAMRWMQDFHQFNRTWWDIGYNFAVGGDGKVYEGRGWNRVGAHAPRYNNISIGVCLIGDWTVSVPPQQQLEAAKNLIAVGVRQHHIVDDYGLVGHRQVRMGTECPGAALYGEIQKWPHYDASPDLRKAKKRVEAHTTVATPPHEDNKLRKRMATLLDMLI